MEQKFKSIEITLPITLTVSGGLIRAGNTPEEGAYTHDPLIYLESGRIGERVISDYLLGYLESEFQADLLDQIEGEI